MRLAIIAAVSQNGAIGKGGDLPWHFPEDTRRFKELTIGHPVIVGRRTFESIGKPLKNRLNIVVSRRKDYDLSNQGVTVAGSIEEALKCATRPLVDEAFCIGGAEIYRQMMPLADKIYLTRIEKHFNGDTFFPEIDMSVWRCIYVSCAGWHGDKDERFLAYFLEFDKSKTINPLT